MRALAILLALVPLVGCSRQADEDPRRTVVASLYPLAWVAEQVGGEDVRVVNLTPPGAEPHDVELAPRDVETIRDADLVIYIGGGFQPAVEDAVETRTGPSLDVLGPGETDPHAWVDPVRFGLIAREVAAALGMRDDGRGFSRALAGFLDRDFRDGLAECERKTIVTSHAAFGRLARRYGLTELSLAGRSPEAEPSPRELERLIEKVRASGATTVFAEPLVSDGVAETVAREAGVSVSTLDPVEGLSEERLAAGEDYLSVMRSNLAALREALGCR
jgi:zinc transport system substrate-binding protein